MTKQKDSVLNKFNKFPEIKNAKCLENSPYIIFTFNNVNKKASIGSICNLVNGDLDMLTFINKFTLETLNDEI